MGAKPRPRKAAAGLVLLVEDDFVLRSSLSEFLTAEGFRVDCCADGREAFRRLHAPPKPNLILLDIMLPYLDGFELRALQRKSPLIANIPVVVISAHDLDPQSVDELGPAAAAAQAARPRQAAGDDARPPAARASRRSVSALAMLETERERGRGALGVARVVPGAVGLAAADRDVDLAVQRAPGARLVDVRSARWGRTGS